MKSMRFFVYAAAALSLAACAKGELAGTGPRTITFHASMVEEDLPPTLAVMGTSGNNKPQVFWEDGDQITVYTSADGASGSQRGYEFSASLTGNAASADFTYTGEGCASGNYLAIYPVATAARTVNFTGDGDIYRIAAVDVPSSQTLVAGSFDRSAAVAVAYAPQGSTGLNFKNAVALIKFRVADSNIKGGSIIVDGADAISGRFRADLSTTEPYIPTLSTYDASGVTRHNFVSFTIDGSTCLSTGTDYYVAVRPTSLTSGLKVYLNGNWVKTISATEIMRNKVYNLGVLSVPNTPVEKGLAFDFTVEPFDGWPNAQRSPNPGATSCVYPLHGTDYTFVLADCGGASAANTFWAITAPINRLALAAVYRYFGLPAIEGYKLVKVTCTNVLLNSSSATTAPVIGITKSISASAAHPAESEYVAPVQTWNKNGHETHTYTPECEANTVYYVYAKAKGAFTGLTLTYEPAQ